VALRYFNIFGPRQIHRRLLRRAGEFITQMLSGEQPTMFGDGEQSRDFTYIDNAVEANLLACTTPAGQVAGKVFNVATGAGSRSIKLSNFCRTHVVLRFSVYAAERGGDIKHSLADISQAEQHLGYKLT